MVKNGTNLLWVLIANKWIEVMECMKYVFLFDLTLFKVLMEMRLVDLI